jgi:hypothetical protein
LAQGVHAQEAATPSAPPESAAPRAAEAWDDSHMRTRHQDFVPPSRPRIEGTSGYAQVLNGGAETKTEVATELEFTSQREWTQGPLSTSSSAKSSSVTKGTGATAPGRGSQLRAGSVSRQR